MGGVGGEVPAGQELECFVDAAAVVAEGAGDFAGVEVVVGFAQQFVDFAGEVSAEGSEYGAYADASASCGAFAYGEVGVESPEVGVAAAAGGQPVQEAVFGEGVEGGGDGFVADGGLFGEGADADVDQGAALDVAGPDDGFEDGA